GITGHRDVPAAGLRLRRCEFARFDPEAWSLWLDFSTLQELEADHGKEADRAWAGYLLAELNRVCNVWDAQDRSTWERARSILRELYEHRNATLAHDVTAVGHAHIDTAWLWPIAETHRKCLRTFATQTRLMDRYPSHRFACSQAEHYAWIKED